MASAWPQKARSLGVEDRTKLFDNREVTGTEFLRKLKKAAMKQKLAYNWNPARGVGSHGTVHIGG